MKAMDTQGWRWARPLLAVLCAMALAACGHGGSAVVTAPVVAGPLRLTVQGEGRIKAVHATSITVPGSNFSSRKVAWLLPDGSRVSRGEVIARFSVQQARYALAEARIDLLRNALKRMGRQGDIASRADKLGVSLADVATQLAIAQRYASAGNLAIARNKILDAVQDRAYLTTRQGILRWERSQAQRRGLADLGVLDAKRASIEIKEKQKQADLDAQVLRAPHAGILELQPDWSGELPQVGSTLWASQPFASLPDLDKLKVVLDIPQLEAQGLAEGQAVELHPLGEPGQSVTSHLSSIAAAAQVISQQSPVKYVRVEALVPGAAVQRWGWVPGQRVQGTIVLLDAKRALSIPNLAIDSSGKTSTVTVLRHGHRVRTTVRLGASGTARSQVLGGLKPGQRVLLEHAGGGNG